ncbi:hypothetical protein [Edwardsiella piscicida]|uniref:hypothetical protein n=1 Tax=Edwardsiella piscicida TaxID=1263550 RepID=UPI000933644B|nr:hypothetical protein [Edwardsiella piscicida]
MDKQVGISVGLALLFCTAPLAAQADQGGGTPPPVKVFTTPWARLFSGSEATFSTALTYSMPLSHQWINVPVNDTQSEMRNIVNQRMLASFQYSPLSYFFANMTVRVPLQDLNRYQTDFVYSFGYDDWHPGTFSLVYSNYGDNNHFYPQQGQRRTYIEQGTITAAYKFALPESWNKHLLLFPQDSLSCQVGYSYGPRYYSLQDNQMKRGKNTLLGSCGYTLKQHYFLRVSAFYYPDRGQQQPWDSDYSYSVGYVSGYEPGSLSIHYDNYSGTRYAWRGDRNANFRQGTLNLSWTLPF